MPAGVLRQWGGRLSAPRRPSAEEEASALDMDLACSKLSTCTGHGSKR